MFLASGRGQTAKKLGYQRSVIFFYKDTLSILVEELVYKTNTVIKCVLKKLLIEIASSFVMSSAAIEIRASWLQHVLSGKACAGKKVTSDRFKR